MATQNKGKVQITPVDLNCLLVNLRLTTGKAAEFCDISRRQLCYWTDKGIVDTIEEENNDPYRTKMQTDAFMTIRR